MEPLPPGVSGMLTALGQIPPYVLSHKRPRTSNINTPDDLQEGVCEMTRVLLLS